MLATLPARWAGRPGCIVPFSGRRNRTLRALTAGLLLCAGCSRVNLDIVGFHDAVGTGNYEGALTTLEKRWDEDDVAVMLNRGLLLESLGRYDESNQVFAKAEEVIDDLYTRSLSKEALSLVTNDTALDYRPPPFESAYIPYFRAWNYLQLGEKDEVLVEARKVDERLKYLATTCPDRDGACAHHVFLRYFSGLLFEWGGEYNDAYVAYRLADEARVSGGIGALTPPDLGVRLVRMARRMGFGEDARLYAEAYGVENAEAPPATVVLFFEHGVVGFKKEESITLPIFKTEVTQISGDVDGWSRKIASRRNMTYEKTKLDYLLRVAIPAYVSTPPPGSQAVFALGGAAAPVPIVDPIDARASAALDEAMGGILVRTVARGLTKYLATRAAESEIGEGAGLIVNLFGAATEQADLRSWVSLPFEIRCASVDVAPGTYAGTLTVSDGAGRKVSEADISGIDVKPGQIVFVRYRAGA